MKLVVSNKENKMKVLTPNDEIPEDLGPSIFLVGPTPRNREIKSWRPEAISILIELGFEGTVVAPEVFGTEEWNPVYGNQIEWEHQGLEKSTVIAAWVPRNIEGDMPAFTTNVEFGIWYKERKFLYGRPEWADKCSYLDYVYYKERRTRIPPTLRELMGLSINYVKELG